MNSLPLAATLFALAVATHPATAATIFSDGFEDGDVSDWNTSSSPGVTAPVVAVRTDSVHAGNFALWTYFDAPGGGVGANSVRASRTFTAPTLDDYTLEFWARSTPCDICSIGFEVLLDGTSILQDATSPDAFKQVQLSLAALSPGDHTLSLGMFTNLASFGRFNATFDDVRITGNPTTAVSEPGLLGMLAILGALGMSKRCSSHC